MAESLGSWRSVTAEVKKVKMRFKTNLKRFKRNMVSFKTPVFK